MINFKKIIIFDIETIPDTEVCKNLLGSKTENIDELRKELTDYHLKITDGKNDFIRQLFHKIVCISCIEVNIEIDGTGKEYFKLNKIGSIGDSNSKEEELVRKFFKIIDDYSPRLITFNGKTFDIPVLQYRAMKYGIVASGFHDTKDKWNNYKQRYSIDFHCDLLEALSDYKASASVKLNEVCSLLGFPGKLDVDGSSVTALFDEGKINEIRDYCETDCLNTYLVYLRYSLHKGAISKEAYNDAVEDILTYIKAHNKTHLNEFKNAWEDTSNNKFRLD